MSRLGSEWTRKLWSSVYTLSPGFIIGTTVVVWLFLSGLMASYVLWFLVLTKIAMFQRDKKEEANRGDPEL